MNAIADCRLAIADRRIGDWRLAIDGLSIDDWGGECDDEPPLLKQHARSRMSIAT